MITQIGKYEVRAELGRGGFGRVFRAYDPTVGRPVAIKTLNASDEPEMLARFRHEASATGKLRHQNIVIIYDFGQHDGAPYLVMELLEGEDLDRIIASRRDLSLLRKLDIMAQAAAGLHHAHSQGIVHRDIKPANIMVVVDGGVKIMDFGIALLTHATATRITPQGSMIGTLPYMAPEQFLGAPSDALTDIFSYGITFYKLLTGTHPFDAPELGGLMFNILHKQATPLRALAPELPESLEQVFNRLLAKDRAKRYQNLEDVQFDVEPIVLSLREQNLAPLISRAREMLALGELEMAQSAVQQALGADPRSRTARELRETVQRQIKAREIRAQEELPPAPAPEAAPTAQRPKHLWLVAAIAASTAAMGAITLLPLRMPQPAVHPAPTEARAAPARQRTETAKVEPRRPEVPKAEPSGEQPPRPDPAKKELAVASPPAAVMPARRDAAAPTAEPGKKESAATSPRVVTPPHRDPPAPTAEPAKKQPAVTSPPAAVAPSRRDAAAPKPVSTAARSFQPPTSGRVAMPEIAPPPAVNERPQLASPLQSPILPNLTAPAKPDSRQQVVDTIRQLDAAIQRKHPGDVKAIWPGASALFLESMASSRVKMSLVLNDRDIRFPQGPDTAIARGDLLTGTGGASRRQRATLTLRHSGDAWIVESVRFE